MEDKTNFEFYKERQWWGEFDVPPDVWCCWKISSMRFYVYRKKNEWVFAWIQGHDPLDSHTSHELTGSETPDLDVAESARFVLSGTDLNFKLNLALADRPMVARPDVQIAVPPGQNATLYVSSTLWLQPTINGSVLLDIPVYRPSDTWFGANTRKGELCYFSLTRARTEASEEASYPNRPTTPINVINRSNEILRIERLRVPTPLLSLYINEQGQFVSNSITVTLDPDSDETEMNIEIEDIKKQKGDFLQVASPREDLDDDDVIESISKLFG